MQAMGATGLQEASLATPSRVASLGGRGRLFWPRLRIRVKFVRFPTLGSPLEKDRVARLGEGAQRSAMAHRRPHWIVVGAAVVGMTGVWRAGAAELAPLSEAEVVRQVLDRAKSGELTRAETDAAQATGAGRGAWPNPKVSYEREEIFDAEVERTLTLSQEIPMGGQAGLMRRVGARRAEAAELRGRARDAQWAADARRAFSQVLFARRQVQILESWRAQVERGRAQAQARESAGDASAVDRMRAERELRRAHAELAAAEAHVAAARGRLAGLLGGSVAIEGELISPRRDLPRPELTPTLRALEIELAALEVAIEAAGRAWIPSVEVGVGLRSSESDEGPGQGFVAGASLSLPIFDRGQAASAELRAHRVRIQAEKERTVAEFQAAWMARKAHADRLRAAAELYANVGQNTGVLVRAAESGYSGGEVDLWQVLDTYREQREDAQTQLELELETRIAEIELDALVGRVE